MEWARGMEREALGLSLRLLMMVVVAVVTRGGCAVLASPALEYTSQDA